MAKRRVVLSIDAQVGEAQAKLSDVNLELARQQEALRELRKDYKKNGGSVREFADAENALKEDIRQLRAEQRGLNKEIELGNKVTRSATGSNEKLRAKLSLLTKQYNKLSKEERETTEEGRKLERQLKAVSDELKRNEEAVGDNRRSVGDYQKALRGIRGGIITAGAAVAPLVAGLQLFSGAIGQGVEALRELNAEFSRYRRLVQSLVGVTGEVADGIIAQVLSITDVFEGDFQEVLVAANAASKAFGRDLGDTLDVITIGFVKGANAQGQFLDSLREYPRLAAEAGLSLEEFVQIGVVATQEGIYSDKGIDAVKEASIALREGTKAATDALEAIGLDSADVFRRLRSGESSTFEVIQEISEQLERIPPVSREVGLALADIFKGAGEDAGLEFIKRLRTVNGELEINREELSEVEIRTLELLEVNRAFRDEQAELARAVGGFGFSLETLTTRARTLALSILNDLVNSFGRFDAAIRAIRPAIDAFIGQTLGNIRSFANTFIRTFGLLADTIREVVSNPFESGDTIKQLGNNVLRLFEQLALSGPFADAGDAAGDAFRRAFELNIAEIEANRKIFGGGSSGGGGASGDFDSPPEATGGGAVDPDAERRRKALETLDVLSTAARDRVKIEEDTVDAEIDAAQRGADIQVGIAESRKKRLEEIAEAEAATRQAGIEGLGQAFSIASGLAKENSIAQKIFASGEALVNTYLAANQALASGAPIPVNFILAALVTAAGLVNVAKINSIGFASGGFTGRGLYPDPGTPGHRVAGVVHDNEYVAPKKVLRDPRSRPAIARLESIRREYGGFASGGFAFPGLSPQAAQSTGLSASTITEGLSEAIKTAPSPVVSVEEINRVGRRVKVKEETGL